ncbi:MAG: hypothetical protein KatS3mg023_3606 [Armatimonadota bacterium]|nr:MAG: hypothetical protein KatS3mg023_3606 [Armatimonadota bacterium]
MRDFGGVLTRQLERVRSVNRSPVLGTPLRWTSGWGDRIPAMLNGWSSGLLLIAGQSNHGKSSLAVSLGLQFLQANPNLWILDFTMDDDIRDRISKYIAILSGLSPDAVKMEHEYLTKLGGSVRERYLQRLDYAYDIMASLDRLIVLDAQGMYEVLHGEENAHGIVAPSIETVQRITQQLYLQLRGTEDQILVIIDAINDLIVEQSPNIGDNERLARIGSAMMNISQLYNARIIATSHARKVTNWRKPRMDDVYGASALKYAAKVITFVYNDYKARRSDSSLTIETEPSGEVIDIWREGFNSGHRSAPILIWNFLKNKTSAMDGNAFLLLDPFTTGVYPVAADEWDYYESLLYQ